MPRSGRRKYVLSTNPTWFQGWGAIIYAENNDSKICGCLFLLWHCNFYKKKKFLFYDVINTPKNCRLEKWRGRTQLNLHTILSGLNYFSGLKTETHTQQYQRQKNINTIKSFTTLIGLSFTWINAWKSVSFEYFQDYEAS